jgi:hypothetical protein
MTDKSPRQSLSKKSSTSIKQKRAVKKAKAAWGKDEAPAVLRSGHGEDRK